MLVCRGGPRLRLADDNAGLALYTHVTLDRATVEAAFGEVKASSAPRTRGRRPKFDWELALREVHAHLAANGYPEFGDGQQANLERMVSSHFGDLGPSESVICQRVAATIAEYRKALEG